MSDEANHTHEVCSLKLIFDFGKNHNEGSYSKHLSPISEHSQVFLEEYVFLVQTNEHQ